MGANNGKYGDRIKDTASSVSGGTVTLNNSAPTGFQTFGTFYANADLCQAYVITDGTNWEVSKGVYTSSGTTLARAATPLASSNGGAQVASFTGTITVFGDAPAAFFNYAFNSYVANNWYPIDPAANVAAGGAQGSGKINWRPFIVTQTITVGALGIRLTTAAAAGNIQLAIYASSPSTGLPTGSALCSTGNISTTSATTVSGSVTAVRSQPGVYWFGINQDNATVVYQGSSTSGAGYGPWLAGSSSISNISGGGSNNIMSWTTTQTFGTWPSSPTVTQGNGGGSPGVPYGFFQPSSVP